MKNNILQKKNWILFLALALSISAFPQKAPLGQYRILKMNKNDSILLVKTWKLIVNSMQTKNYGQIKKLSLEEVYGMSLGHIWPDFFQDQSVPIDSFINIALIRHNNQHFIDIISDSSYRINLTEYQNRKFPNFKLGRGQNLKLYDLYYVDLVPVGNGIRDENYYVIRFVKVNGKFKFFGLSLEWPSAIKQ